MRKKCSNRHPNAKSAWLRRHFSHMDWQDCKGPCLPPWQFCVVFRLRLECMHFAKMPGVARVAPCARQHRPFRGFCLPLRYADKNGFIFLGVFYTREERPRPPILGASASRSTGGFVPISICLPAISKICSARATRTSLKPRKSPQARAP